jgi:transcriptional regulator
LSTKIEQLDWRRSKVVELRVRGLSQTEIARELQVSKASITADIQYLRSQAKESIKEYVTEYLPKQYQVCLSALDTILKHAFEILQDSDDNRKAAGYGAIQGYAPCQARATVECYNH